MNKILLLGRLVKEPDVRYTSTGKVVCQFVLAVDRPFANNGQKETDFLPVVIWGKQAAALGNYVNKGQRVLVEGRVQTRSYDAKDGNKRYITEVIAERFEFIERKGGAASQSGQYSNQSAMENFGEEVQTTIDQEIPF